MEQKSNKSGNDAEKGFNKSNNSTQITIMIISEVITAAMTIIDFYLMMNDSKFCIFVVSPSDFDLFLVLILLSVDLASC